MNTPRRRSLKLALAQMQVVGGDKQTNLRRAEAMIGQAARAGAAIVVLPEAMTLGWTHNSARTDADTIPEGIACRTLSQAARGHHLYVCAGVIERKGNQIFNSALLIGPDGELLAHHRKLNELHFAHELYGLGDRLQVTETPLGRVGVMICADGFACGQVISRALGYMGADLILSPSAWAVPADHDNAKEPYGQLWLDNYGPVARDFRLWVAGVSNVGWITDGPWKGRKCIGCSLVVDPNGQPALQGPYGVDAEALLYLNIELVPRPAQGDGWVEFWKTQAHRK